MNFEELLQKITNELGLFRAKLESLTYKRYDVRFEEDNSEGKFKAIFTQIEEKKKTLSDEIFNLSVQRGERAPWENIGTAVLNAQHVKQILQEFIDDVNSKYASEVTLGIATLLKNRVGGRLI